MKEDNIQDLLPDNSNVEISKVQLPNGEIYNFKDAELREQIKAFLGDLGAYEKRE